VDSGVLAPLSDAPHAQVVDTMDSGEVLGS
jgi:hypothetical protein